VILRLAVLIQYRRVTHRHTLRQTRDYGYYPRRDMLRAVKSRLYCKLKVTCRLLLPTELRGVSVCQSVCHLVSSAKMAEAIEMPFASRTRVGPGKHLLRIADRFEANTVLCLFKQYSHLVYDMFTQKAHVACNFNYLHKKLEFSRSQPITYPVNAVLSPKRCRPLIASDT